MTMEELQQRVATLEEQVRILRPDVPRFGREDALEQGADLLHQVSEEHFLRSSMSTEHLRKGALAQLPTSGLRDGALAWVSDGRKAGEGAGAGTGVLAYYDVATTAWRVLSDDTAVAT